MTLRTNQSTGWTEIPGHGDTLRFDGRARQAHELSDSTVEAFDEYDRTLYAEGLGPSPVA